MRGLRITKPEELTSAKLVYSNVPENDYLEYSSGTTYAKGDRCITSATHQVWQSAEDGNIGNNPLTTSGKWVSPGATNRWRAFDDSISTQTAYPDQISYEIKPFSAITSVNVLNVVGCTSIRVRMIDPTFGDVYDKTVSMLNPPETPSWWVWTFGGRKASTLAAFDDLPSYPSATIYIDLFGGENLAVGVIGFGQQREFGFAVQLGSGVGMISHSVRERDEFGNLRLVRRLPSKRMNFVLMLDNTEVDSLNSYLMDIDAIPCFFNASEEFESMNVYGIIGNFDTRITYPYHSMCDIEIEGLQ